MKVKTCIEEEGLRTNALHRDPPERRGRAIDRDRLETLATHRAIDIAGRLGIDYILGALLFCMKFKLHAFGKGMNDNPFNAVQHM